MATDGVRIENMSRLRESFTISLYLIVCLASLMMGLAEGGWMVPTLLTLPVAAAAFFVVEQQGRGISTWVANSLGLAAIAVAFAELMTRDVEGRILFGAHLLVYLSWIVLWQPKGSQQHWSLVALAILQIAVGSLLTSSGAYGVAMVLFVALVVWTLVLMQLVESAAGISKVAASPSMVESGPRQLLASGHVAPTLATMQNLWRPRQILAVVNVTVIAAMAVGGLFFLLIPRLEVGRRSFDDSETALAQQRVTGFSERVRLGAFGEILESSVPVFEVRIFDGENPVDVEAYASQLGLEEPLFRGLVLSHYEHGEWSMTESGFPRPLPAWPFADQIRQEYRLKTRSTEVLFAISPVYAGHLIGDDTPIRWRSSTDTIFRPSEQEDQKGDLGYEVFSPRDGAIVDVLRESSNSRWGDDDRRAGYLELPAQLDVVRQMAADVTGQDVAGRTDTEKAQRLLSWLRDSGTFQYSLTGELIDSRLDPVEDFLVNRRSGHCEYFASALALLLRAEGIPSRVVSGFKGGEINRLNGSFVVQQRHAHAWVEARLGDRWVTLDPTPASQRNESVAANAPAMPLWGDLRSAVSNLWVNYVLTLDMNRQRQVLKPLRELAVSMAERARDQWWPALKAQIYVLATDPSRWFSWQGGVATFLGLSLLVALWRLGRRLRARFSQMRANRAERAKRGRHVDFYERFRRLCERAGWTSDVGQTPREFAEGVATALRQRAVSPSSQSLPADLTEEFYRVRFGNETLTESDHAEIVERLSEFEDNLFATTPKGRSAASMRELVSSGSGNGHEINEKSGRNVMSGPHEISPLDTDLPPHGSRPR